MKVLISIVYLAICLNSFSQKRSFDIATKYPVKEILKDIDYTEKYLTKFHPDPYRYISMDSLHAFVLKVKSQIDTPLNEMQIRFYLKQIAAKIGCGHTDIISSKAYRKAIHKLSRPILPINAFLTDSEKLIVLNNLSSDSTIKAGDEIVSIDNHATSSILKTIYSVFTTDGYNKTYKKQGIKNDWFKYYYSFCYGFHSPYKVSIKQNNGTVSSHTLLAISSLKDTLILPKKDSANYIQQTKKCRYSVLHNENKPIAVIDIDGFSGKQWRRFCRKSFKDIRRRKIDNLVIDLRDNGGGRIDYGFNFLSYLINKPILLPFDRKPNLLAFNLRIKMNPLVRLSPILFTTLAPSLPKHGRIRHYFFALPKHKNAYKGNIYVLVNGKSFSMSCIATSYLKYKANATIIGEETGGNISGSNAVFTGKLILPNTKIGISIPFYHIYHDIEVENKGYGIIPDYPTAYGKEDILNSTDIDLSKAKELINLMNRRFEARNK